MKVYSGKYKVKNLEKYKGDPTKVVYRSSWERKFMHYCDMSSKVLEWSSEEVVVPYVCPTDSKQHRYFVDFAIKTKDAEGNIQKLLIEIKPKKETVPPRKSANKQRYVIECMTYAKNQAKWKAATAYAEKRGMKFVVLTEYDLGIKVSYAKK